MVLIVIGILAGCEIVPIGSSDPKALTQTGSRIYRGDMFGHQGLVFFAAHTSALTAVYDTARCGLYLAWKGPVLGSERDSKGRYVPQGPLYLLRDDPSLWTVLIGGDTVPSTIRMISFDQDSTAYLAFHYSLNITGGRSLRIDEGVMHDNHYGDNALIRTFKCEGLDSTTTVRVKLGGQRGRWTELWSLGASGNLEGVPGEETLVMTYDGTSLVKVTWTGSGDI